MSKKKTRLVEEAMDEDLESEDFDTYKPEDVRNDLECDESAYRFLEYINVGWPSQTVDFINESKIVLSESSANEKPHLITVDFIGTDSFKNMNNLVFDRYATDETYNRIRCKNNSYCISDTTLSVYNKSFDETYRQEFKEGLGYGFTFADNGYICGSKLGEVIINNYTNQQMGKYKLHDGQIETLSYFDSILYSGSCDHSISLTDMRCMDTIFTKKFNCDINALDFNEDNKLVFGDDNGMLRLMDIRNHSIQEIDWHKSPISCIKWRDRDTFGSCSDEQFAIWDIELQGEDWDHEEYLLFVHQGQTYYKDFQFCGKGNNYVLTTSADGVCLFSPISFYSVQE